MSIVDFLSDLRRAGIHISLNEDKLKIKAPSGALTNDIKLELKNRKEDIISFLRESTKEADTSSIPVVDRSGELPLSFSQQGLWFIDQMHPGSVAYNMPFAVKLTGQINLDALNKAIAEIIKRHESLRSRFVENEEGVPHVLIDKPADYAITQREQTIEGELNKGLLALAGKEAMTPFDLKTGPLFRFQLIQVRHEQGDVSLLLGSIHHIISDGWSMSVLLREIAVLYSVYVQGGESPLPPLPIQYPDFAAWQREFLQGDTLEEQLGFWRNELAGVPSLLALPTDRVRPPEQTSNGAKYEFKLDDSRIAALETHCKKLGITLFTGLMAAWQLLLSQYAQQDKFCVGIPMAGRSRKETENLIGFFVNALMVKADLTNNPTVAEFVERVKNTVLGAFSHQDVPLQLILDDLNVPRTLAHQPLAQVGFQLQNFSGQGATDQEAAMIEKVAEATQLRMEPVVSDEAASKYDMILTMVQQGGGISGNVEYNTDLFDRSTIARMVEHFERAMDVVMYQSERPVQSITLATDDEIRAAIGVDASAGELLPLSSTQMELFLDSLVNPDTVQNATGYWLPVYSELDVGIFQKAVAHVASQSPILDARFYTCDLPYAEAGYQVLPAEPESHFEFIDYTGRDWHAGSAAFREELNGWLYSPRDIFTEPLYVVRLYQFTETEYFLAVYSHHLVADGLSFTTHAERVAETYRRLNLGEPLPTWQDNYREFVEQDRLTTDSGEVIQYWNLALKNVEPLNFSVPPNADRSSDYAVVGTELTDQESQLVRDYCAREQIHPSELFRAMTAYLTKAYCRPENDFVLLEIQGGRNRSNYDQVGVYYRQVPFVVGSHVLGKDHPVADFFEFSRQQQHEVKPYRTLSMNRQRALIGQGRLAFMFNYYNFMRDIALAESHETIGIVSPHPENVVQVVVRDVERLHLSIMYETCVFAEQGFIQRLKTLVLEVAQGTATSMGDLALISQFEAEQLDGWNQTQRELPANETVVDWFERQVESTPDQVALIFGEQQLTYAQLNAQANQLANYLIAKGVQPQDRVAISLGRSLDMIVSVWAVIKAGATYIPVDVNYPKERLAFLIEDSNASCLVTESCMLDRLPETTAVRVLVDAAREQIQIASAGKPGVSPSPQDLIYIIYTSGSTGKPKGAAVRHHGEVNLLTWYTNDLGLGPSDRALVISAFGFDLTQKNLFAMLVCGGTLVVPAMDQYDDAVVLETIRLQQITLVNCAPSAFYPLVDDLDDDRAQALSSLRYLVLGGEPIRLAALYPWLSHRDSQCQLVNSYGPTECTDVVSYHILDEIAPDQTLIPIGKPINNTQLFVVDDELNRLPAGLTGELCIAGDGVGVGYIGRDDLTAEVFIDNPFGKGKLYKTGDLARYLNDGNIEYMGRKDFQIKLRGLRIELGEIEHALRQLQGVSDGLAMVLNEQLVAYVVADDRFDNNAWRQRLADYLPEYMVPAHVVTLEAWPLTPNGKVDRKALPAPDQASRRVAYVEPRNDIERTLAQIWSQVLKVEEVGVYDNFFDLGGHSLLATQVASRARKAFNANIQLRDLLGEPTIASIAKEVERIIQSGGGIAEADITPANRDQRLPLSFAQQRLWLLDKIEPGSVAYNVPLAVRIEGDLDISALEQAFQRLIDRHEVLRTAFLQDDEGASLNIAEQIPFQLRAVDVNVPENELETEVRRLVAIEIMTPFSLEQAPLIRAKLYRLPVSDGKPQFVLSVVLHHIITDGWSMGILIKELGACYVALQKKAEPPLTPLAIQYADFSAWQRHAISDEVLENHLAFWKGELGGVPSLNLPADYPRPNIQTYNGRSLAFELPESIKQRFLALARQQNTTPFVVLMAAYAAFLHRYTGQDDFAVGSPVAGRDHPDLGPVVGFFVNTLVVRHQFEGISDFSALVKAVSGKVLQNQAHQQIPFEQIVDVVEPARDMSRSPIFQTMLTYQNLPVDKDAMAATDAEMGDIRFSPVSLDIESAKYELMLTVTEGSESDPYHCQLQYNTDLFASDSMAQLAKHFANFCESVSAAPEQPLHAFSMLDNEEINTQLYDWNDTGRAYDKNTTVHQRFDLAATEHADRIAIKCGEQFFTYQQLATVSNHIANALIAQGVKPDDKVGLCFNRHLGLMPAILGILKAGATYVPLDASYPEGRIRYIVEDAGIPLVLTTQDIAGDLALDGIEFFAIDELLLKAEEPADKVSVSPDPERLLYMIYTSGSTGRPKGTGAFHRSEINLLDWYCREFDMSPHERVLLMSAIGFDLTQKNLFAPLVSGAALVIPAFQEYDPGMLIPLIRQEQISWINCAPSAFYPLQDDSKDWQALRSLKHVFLGGEPINLPRLQSWMAQTSCRLINSYGPTECTDIAAWHRIDLEEEAHHAVLPIGRPNDNVRLYILGNHLELLPIGAVGELCIGGDSVGPGYLNNPELTAEVFAKNPHSQNGETIYRTGDLARYRKDGVIEYLGRRDQQVKLRGFRIETGEIQGVINEYTGITDSLVSVMKTEAAEQLVAWVVVEQLPEQGSDAESELLSGLKKHAGHYLPTHMVPSFWCLLSEFPLTPNGKIDRKALPQPAFGDDRPLVEPRTDLEKSIAAIWSSVLGLNKVGVDQNFFHLGGHSLLATKVIARLAKELGKEIPVKLLFEAPTIETLAEKLYSLDTQALERPPIRPCGLTDDIPLSLGQQRLWLFEQLNPGTATNNMPAAVNIKGELNIVAVQRAVNELLRRHASLRTVFYTDQNEQPRQKILNELSGAVNLIDLTAEEDPDLAAMLAAEKDRSEPFDLLTGPLMRVSVLKVRHLQYMLTINMHHIISDGVSVSIMLRELITLYYVFDRKVPSPLPELSLQYADYAVWQQNYLQGDVLEGQLSYWDQQLAHAPVTSTFPTDHPRPLVQSTNGKTRRFQFDPAFAKKLHRHCQQNGVTPFMYMFAIWSLLLSRYARQDDLCIGIPTAGRPQPELDNIIGFFINSMVLRVDFTGNPSVKEHLERVRNVVLDGFANGDVPVETIVERLSLERNPACTPLVQVAFQLLVDQPVGDAADLSGKIAGLDIDVVETEGVTAKFDMLLTLNQGDDYLLGALEYNTDLYNDATIEKIVQQYMDLASRVMDDAGHSVNHYPFYSDAELFSALKLDGNDYERVMPLTTTQQAFLWNLQINPDTLQYSVGYSYEIRRSVNESLFRQALQIVSDQFVALRTEFRLCDLPGADMAYQCVRRSIPVMMDVEDVSPECTMAVEDRQAFLKPKYEDWVYRSYDVMNDPLIAFKLLKAADDHYFYLFRGHHIALDGIAGRSLLDKSLEVYLALEAGEAVPGYTDRYPEYITQHNDKMDKPEAEAFWQKELASVEPLDFSKPPLFAHDPQYQVLYHGLSETKTKAIKQYCRKQKIHPSIYFRYLAAVMLDVYCRAENDFVVYEIQSGRSSGHEDALGVYYQQVPYHYEKALFRMEASPEDFYKHQKTYRKKIRGYTDVSLALQDQIAGHGRIGFQYNYFNFIQDVPFGDLAATPDVQSSHVENTVQVFIKEFDNTFNLELWMDGRVFIPLDFLPRMEWLSDQLSGGDVSRVRDFDLLLEQEKQDYKTWNAHSAPAPQPATVVEWFEAQVLESPDALAVQCGKATLSYKALNAKANQLANWLQSRQVGRGDFVAICMDRSVMMLEAIWGVLKSGACYIPIEAGYPQERVRYMLEDSGAQVMLTESCLEERFSELAIDTLLLDKADAELVVQSDANLNVPLTSDDLIYVIYTSGSTGQPKGALVTHGGEVNLQNWYINRNNLAADDRLLIISAFGFDLTQKNFFAPLLVGGAVVIPDVEGYDPAAFSGMIQQESITLLNCAPSAFYPIVESCGDEFAPLASLRHVWLGGEPIRMEGLNAWYQSCDTILVNSYGPTECTDVVAAYSVPKNQEEGDPLPIGAGIDNTSLYIINDNDQLCPPGLIGEICIAGASVGKGYLGKDDLTQAAFTDHEVATGKLYRTGDLGRYLPDGNIEYIGRKDFQVKLRGLRIELGEIEFALTQLPGVKDGLVMVVDEQLVAYIVGDHKEPPQGWREALAGYLPDYMVPGFLVCLEQWPLTPNGKVDRNALPEPDQNQRRVPYVAPRDDIEAAVAAIWSQVLKVDEVGVDDDFYDLGGHSLLATQIASRIRRDLNVDVQMRDLLGEPTVASVAKLLQSLSAKTDQRPPIKPCGLTEDIPLSLGQQRLWFFEQMNPGSVANNMPAAVRLKGDLNLTAIKAAFVELSNRHDSLRTVFYMGADGEPKQKVLAAMPSLVEVVDYSDREDKEQRVLERVAEDRSTGFDLTKGPLLRAQLIQLGEVDGVSESVLTLCMHHIISDGFSVAILLRELTTLYYVFANKLPSPLQPLDLQYADFAVWQRRHLQGDVLESQLDYWDAQLKNPPKLSTFPPDMPRPEVQTTNGKNYGFRFDAGFVQDMQRFCRELGITPFMFTFSIWSMLLSRYNGQDDLCIGIPTAGRHTPELEPLIGFFINSMILRADFSGNPSAREALERARQLVLDGFENADLPIEMLLERLPLERNLSYTPLVQSAFQLLVNEKQELPAAELASSFGGLEVEQMQGEGVSAKFDTLLTLNLSNQEMQGTLEYNTDLYKESTIARLCEQFKRLAAAIVADPDHRIGTYELYTQAELCAQPSFGGGTYERVLPLNSTQEAFLLHLQMKPDTLQYSVGCCFEINRSVDQDLLLKAMLHVKKHFIVFNTEFKFSELPGSRFAYQAIRSRNDLSVEFVSSAEAFDGDEDPGQARIDAWLEEWVYQPYDIFSDPLLEFRLLTLPGERTYFATRAHHIVFDGVTGIAAMNKVLDAYLALEYGKPMPDFEDRYPEFITQNADTIDLPENMKFWRYELEDVEPLDFSKPPQANADNEYHVIRHALSEEKSKQVKKYCRKHRMHASVYFRYLTTVLLNSYCRAEKDFVIYEISAGRDAGHEDALGVYYQQVPYHYERALFSDEATPEDFYTQQKQYRKKLRGRTNMSLQFQNELLGARIGFQYNYFHFLRAIPFGDAKARLNMQSSHVEDTVQVFIKEFEDHFSLELWYDGAVFTPLDFLPRMEMLSDQLSGAEVETVKDFQLLLPEEKDSYASWNERANVLDSEANVVSLFVDQVNQAPDALAIVCGSRQLTYKELNEQSNRVAHWLINQGVQSSDFIAICMDRSAEMLVSLWAVLKAGCAYIPIEASYPKDRISYILDNSNARALITQQCLTERFTDYQGLTLVMDASQSQLSSESAANPAVVVSHDDPIYVIYTSGSTGVPKGALVTHKGELNLQQWYISRNGLGAEDKCLIVSAFGFDLTQKNFFAPLLSGGVVVLPEGNEYDPTLFANLIQQHGVTLLNCAPSAFYPIVEHCGDYAALSSLQYVWLGGEPIRMSSLAAWYKASDTVLVNSYGPTECTDVVSAHSVSKNYAPGDPLPIGSAIDNAQLFVLNSNHQLCPPGVVGEICIAGACVGLGYLNNPELTQEAFIEHPACDTKLYKTGDLGRYLPNGELEYIGRKDFQVKLRGLRIELSEIESALKSIPAIEDALLLVRKEVLVSYVLADKDADASDWKSILRDRLPEYMVPHHIVRLQEWPLTPNGKIDRQALPDPSDADRSVPFVAPRTSVEKKLQQIWMSVLELEEIGVKDNFFEIGGHSLLGVRIIDRIDQELGISLQAIDLLNSQTIEKLAKKVEEKGVGESFTPLVPLKVGTASQNMFFVHPIGGDVLCYRELVEQIPDTINCYGLRCRGLDPSEPVYASLNEMVNAYTDAVLSVQSDGSVILAGQSLGGVLALAIADQLKQRGVSTEKVVMLDTYAPSHLNMYFGDEVDMIQAALGMEFPEQVRELKDKNPDQWLQMLYNMARGVGLLTEDVSFARISAIYQVSLGNFGFSAEYPVNWNELPEIIHFSASDSKNRVKASESWLAADAFDGSRFSFTMLPAIMNPLCVKGTR